MIMKQRLIDSLLELKTQALNREIKSKYTGICFNWKEILSYSGVYDIVENFQQDWLYRSGDPQFPVLHSVGFGLWEGKNLEMRLSLIDHILKRLDEVDQDYIDDLID